MLLHALRGNVFDHAQPCGLLLVVLIVRDEGRVWCGRSFSDLVDALASALLLTWALVGAMPPTAASPALDVLTFALALAAVFALLPLALAILAALLLRLVVPGGLLTP
jgi:hypothetical protein